MNRHYIEDVINKDDKMGIDLTDICMQRQRQTWMQIICGHQNPEKHYGNAQICCKYHF